jgi:5-methylthioadenosine/S-adenosylhomocysteine deaminase
MVGGGGNLLVRGGTLLDRSLSPPVQDILVLNGRIEEVGSLDVVPGVPELDASNSFVLPGFVNAHMHSGENFNPGRFENLPLDLWYVYSHDLTRVDPLSPETIYARTLLGAIQAVLTGTTTIVDFLYEAPEITEESLEAVIRAYLALGLRATIVLGVSDKPFLESLPLQRPNPSLVAAEPAPPKVEELLELLDGSVDQWDGCQGLIRLGVGPSGPQRCSEELLKATAERALNRGLVWHTHVQETKTQFLSAQRWYGKTFIELLDELGVLSPRSSIVHAVWLMDRDIELVAERGVTVIHCLLSNLRLGDGIARLPNLHAKGVRLALGTDGRGCDESLDMLELQKVVSVLHKNHGYPREYWPTADQVLEMATSGGSQAAGYGDSLGRIRSGAFGDLILVRKDHLAFLPLHDPVRQLVYGSASRAIRAVVVNGRVVVEEGEFAAVDAREVIAEIRSHTDVTPQNVSRARTEEGPLVAAATGVWEEAEATDVGIGAYIGGQRAWRPRKVGL